jgi:hypothetical protein
MLTTESLGIVAFRADSESIYGSALKDVPKQGVFARSIRIWSGWKLVPAKWRYLVPEEHRDGAQSRPPAGIPLGKYALGDDDASRWALELNE